MNSDSTDFEQWAQLRVGVRLPVDVTPEDWFEKLEELIDDSQLRESIDFHLTIEPLGFAIPAWEGEKNSKLVRAFLNGIRSQGGEPRFVYKTGTADSNIVAPVWGCPVVVYGPGDSSLDHTPNEHLDLNEYKKAVDVLREALVRLVST